MKTLFLILFVGSFTYGQTKVVPLYLDTESWKNFSSYYIIKHNIDTSTVTVMWDSLGYVKISTVFKIRYSTDGWTDSSWYIKDRQRFYNFKIMEWRKQ